jgi:Ubiquitin-conjugating enzyme
MSSVSQLRRTQDQQLLLNLIARSEGGLKPKGQLNTQSERVTLELSLPTVASIQFPSDVQTSCTIEVQLPLRYPFTPPSAKVLSPQWHPNVWPNGNICLGTRWQATEGLDLFVARLVKLLIYDPLLVNLQSMANSDAGHWYKQTLKNHPSAFPTVQTHAGHWLRDPRGLNQTLIKVEKACIHCNATLRLPVGRTGIVQCPKCRCDFEVST